MLQSTMEFLHTIDRVKLRLQRWPSTAAGPLKGTVQIVHGLGEHIGRYEPLALALNAVGWNVAGHDLRGHGHSEGPRGTIAGKHTMLFDLGSVIDHVRGPGKHVLLGHSLGGLIAARFVAEELASETSRWLRDVDGLVLSSPAFDTGISALDRLQLRVMQSLMPNLRVHNRLKPEWLSRDRSVVQRYVADPLVHNRITPALASFIIHEGLEVRQRAPRWRTPTLLMWAGADRCVAPIGSRAFAHAAPKNIVTAQEYPALFHEIFNEPERQRVFNQLGVWLERFNPPT
jgi:alpha-beta hydrolase superfamily lysophospholipase